MAWKAYYQSWRDDSINAIYVDILFQDPATSRQYTKTLHYLPESLTSLAVFKANVAEEVAMLNRFDGARTFLDTLTPGSEVKDIVLP